MPVRRALLLIAPRHPERFDPVAQAGDTGKRPGSACVRRSQLEFDSPSARPPGDVLLLDTLGELAGLYRVADVAFIGGTLVANRRP